MMESKTKTMTRVAMLSALAFAAVLFIRIPMVLFLEYDPKNVIINNRWIYLGTIHVVDGGSSNSVYRIFNYK